MELESSNLTPTYRWLDEAKSRVQIFEFKKSKKPKIQEPKVEVENPEIQESKGSVLEENGFEGEKPEIQESKVEVENPEIQKSKGSDLPKKSLGIAHLIEPSVVNEEKVSSPLSAFIGHEDAWEETRARAQQDPSIGGQKYRLGFRWTKTDSYSEESFCDERIINKLLTELKAKDYVFQLERGEGTGKFHWQGYMNLKTKKVPCILALYIRGARRDRPSFAREGTRKAVP